MPEIRGEIQDMAQRLADLKGGNWAMFYDAATVAIGCKPVPLAILQVKPQAAGVWQKLKDELEGRS